MTYFDAFSDWWRANFGLWSSAPWFVLFPYVALTLLATKLSKTATTAGFQIVLLVTTSTFIPDYLNVVFAQNGHENIGDVVSFRLQEIIEFGPIWITGILVFCKTI